jgi:hypothetical protein
MIVKLIGETIVNQKMKNVDVIRMVWSWNLRSSGILYEAQSGNSVATFRDNLSVPSLKVQEIQKDSSHSEGTETGGDKGPAPTHEVDA